MYAELDLHITHFNGNPRTYVVCFAYEKENNEAQSFGKMEEFASTDLAIAFCELTCKNALALHKCRRCVIYLDGEQIKECVAE